MAAGDERALEALYAAYSLRVYNYALRLLHNESDAEEVLQDVFLGAWKNARRFKYQSRVTTWLLRIAHYCAVDCIKSRQYKRAHLTASLDEFEEWLPDKHSANEFERVDQINAVQIAMSRLSADHRAVIELTFVHGLSYNEISEVTMCTIGTVKSRMHYALRYMRRFLLASSSA